MRLFKSLAVALTVSSSLFAQEISNVKTGPDNDQTTKILKVLGENDHGIFYMAGKKNDLYVQRYSTGNLHLELNEKVDIPEVNGVKLELEEMFLVGNNILLFATGFDANISSYVTYSFVIDEKGQVVSDGNLTFSMEVEKKNRAGTVEYRQSIDKKHILIYNRAYHKKESLVRYSFLLLDNEGKQEVNKSFDVGEGEGKELVLVTYFALDKNNDIHTCVSRSLYVKSTKETNQRFEVVSYRKSNNYEPVSTELTLGANNLISSVVVSPKKDGSIAVGGFYVPMKNGKRATGIEGTFYTTISQEGEAEAFKIQPFSNEFKSKIISDRQVGKGTDLPLTYVMKEAYTNDDDEISFVAEDYVLTPGQGAGGNSYYYGYIIVIKVSASGEIAWEQVINKRQLYQEIKVGLTLLTSGSGLTLGVTGWITVTSDKNIYLSYKSWSNNGDLIFLFNDEMKNKDLAVDEKRDLLSRPLKGAPFTATISAEGTLTYFQESELGDEETVLRPRMTYVQDGKIYFITAKKDVEKVGTGTIK